MTNASTTSEPSDHPQTSLSTAAARKLAHTTKSVPQMQGISSRWLLKVLPWVQVSGGVYRVNRQLSYAIGDGRVTFTKHDGAGRAAIELAAGHTGEPVLPRTYVDYEAAPREYELSVAQTVLQVHTRVADLFNEPMNQTEQQLRLTVEALKERQEHEVVNSPDFGLLHSADRAQRIRTGGGPPTPDDMDELLATVWKDPSYFFAHPRAIAAFGQECSRRGIYPTSVDMAGNMVPAWRGIPILPCNKIPVTESHTSSILVMRVGEDSQGVVGLHQAGIPDEIEPSMSVRFMGINDKAIISYLVSAYFSVAVLVPDALGILDNVALGRAGD